VELNLRAPTSLHPDHLIGLSGTSVLPSIAQPGLKWNCLGDFPQEWADALAAASRPPI